MKYILMTVRLWAVALSTAFLSSACDGPMSNPTSSGRPYEMMVIVDDSLWMRPAGRALFDILDTDIPGLPQPERSFKISQADPSRFNRVLNMFRNIIMVDIDKDQYTQPKMRYVTDEYAHPQVILTLQSPSEQELLTFLQQNSETVLEFFNRVEMNRLVKELHKTHSPMVNDMAQEMFDCSFWAPKEIQSYKKGKDFFWTSSNSASALVNICMYSYPYEGPATFNKAYVLAKRDSVMKANIPGAQPDMYMATDTLLTDVKPINVRDQYAMETRGLWHMMNDGMGGPFVAHSRVDTLNNRVIVVEGFVYAPEKMKRGLIRRLEGALYTLTLPAEQVSDELGVVPEVEVTANRN